MCFDRNINGNRDVRFLECDYLLVQRCVKLTLVALYCNAKSKDTNDFLIYNDIQSLIMPTLKMDRSQKSFFYLRSILAYLLLKVDG